MKLNTQALHDPRFSQIIDTYRLSIKKRYNSKRLENYPSSKSISQDKIEELIEYFLVLLYPPLEERKRLDLAFQSLSGFVHSPSKLWGILGSLGSAIWSLGRDLGGAFRAGMAALQSYVNAHKLEHELYLNALPIWNQEGEIKTLEDLEKLMKYIPPQTADEFREEIVLLFQCIGDRNLLLKIISIMEKILISMKNKPQLYHKHDIEGIEIGLNILNRGFVMFEKLTKEEIQDIITTIDSVERDYFHNEILKK
jgi:hypothetical protein